MTIALSNLFRFVVAAAPVFPGVVRTPAPPPVSTLPAPAPVPVGTSLDVAGAIRSSYVSPLALDHPWISHTLAGLFVISAISLVILLAFQTTKQEGLSGTIGGRVESSYRPRLGADQQMARTTSYVAIAFAFLALLLSLTGI